MLKLRLVKNESVGGSVCVGVNDNVRMNINRSVRENVGVSVRDIGNVGVGTGLRITACILVCWSGSERCVSVTTGVSNSINTVFITLNVVIVVSRVFLILLTGFINAMCFSLINVVFS